MRSANQLSVIGLAALLAAFLGADRVLLRLHDPRPGNAPAHVMIYTTAWCGRNAIVRPTCCALVSTSRPTAA